MQPFDYVVLVLVLLILLGIGAKLSKISSKNTSEFMVAGRKMPWWLIGVAGTAVGLNTDAMLADSRKVRQDGVIGLMHAWGFAFKGCVAGVFFDRLWRRARFKTQMEFYRARYSGWQANFARIYDTVIFGGFVTSIWAALGLVGMKKIIVVVLGLPPTLTLGGITLPMDAVVVIIAVLIALMYSASAGARGVFWTDLVQLGIALIVMYVLFIILYIHIGGSVGLRENLETMPGEKLKYLSFLQPFSIVYIGMFFVNPILDHGGFNPGAQRLLSLKDEREVLYTLIFSNVLAFVARGLPFVGIGLIGMFIVDDQTLLSEYAPLYTPEGVAIPDWEKVFPILAREFLPVGLTGLLSAAFICAFMSSFDANIHLTGSVVVNDFYRPYLVKKRSDQHYVKATKVTMALASLATIYIGIVADDVLYLAYLAITISLGGGWIKLLRLIWWRTNGNAEVAAQMCALVIFGIVLSPLGTEIVTFLTGLMGLEGNDAFIVTRNLTASLTCTAVAIPIMMFSKPEPMEKLCSFYRRMRPFGFWGPVRAELGDSVKQPDSIPVQMALVLCSVAVVWGTFFGGMCFLLAMWQGLAASLALITVGGIGVYCFILRLYPKGEAIAEYDGDEDDD
jgi:SSS family solute:Na+ symporter